MQLDPSVHPIQGLEFTRPRIMGGEQEYGIWTRRNKKSPFNNESWGIEGGDQFTENGSRVYLDVGHPEYASPEAPNPLINTLYDRAGEIIIPRLVHHTNNKKNFVKGDTRILKHNTDGRGKFFSAHESYSMASSSISSSDEQRFIQDLKKFSTYTLPFFVSRQIFAGNGYLNSDGKFELSQRSTSIDEELGGATTRDRAIINTRFEPHADRNNYSRLHLIVGDSNMADPSIFLKYGATSLVLDLFEDGFLKPTKLAGDPVLIIKEISKDIEFKNEYKLKKRGSFSAIEIQRIYLEEAVKRYSGRDSGTDEILRRWDNTVNHIREENATLDGQIDWRIKKRFLEEYCNKKKLSHQDLKPEGFDYLFHDISRERGIFQILERRGFVEWFFTEDQIEYASNNPPEDTRASFRGKAVKAAKKGKNVLFKSTSNWQKVQISDKEYNLEDPYNNYSKLEYLLETD